MLVNSTSLFFFISPLVSIFHFLFHYSSSQLSSFQHFILSSLSIFFQQQCDDKLSAPILPHIFLSSPCTLLNIICPSSHSFWIFSPYCSSHQFLHFSLLSVLAFTFPSHSSNLYLSSSLSSPLPSATCSSSFISAL